MLGKDLLSVSDLTCEEVFVLMRDAADLKKEGWLSLLSNKSLAIVFEKPSLRTRLSFELAMRQLGGEAIYLSPAEVGLGKRESVPDVARVLNRYVSAITARTFSHQTLEVMATHTDIPVINALSDWEHPCQAMADLLTIYERKDGFEGLSLAYVGDGNNVINSLLLASSMVGISVRIASPDGYRIDDRILDTAQGYAQGSGAEIMCTDDPRVAVDGVDIVYTDVWTSMGQEAEYEERCRVFAPYRVDSEIMSCARDDAIFMHPLPAHRGDEVTDSVIDSPQSVVFDQAENRLHAQKAILAKMLGGLEIPLPGY